jgi:MoxR-like ATPase
VSNKLSSDAVLEPGSSVDVKSARARLRGVRDAMCARLIEREEVVEAALAALVAGQHVVLLGPPGTAKSLVAQTLCQAIGGARFFGRLLTRFTTPEELFGPLDLRALEEGRYERLMTGYLPEAHVGFLDEIFKASSAILNALLTLLNERKFHNGVVATDVPLVGLIAASNEIPDEGALAALYDRFLVRYWVEPIQDSEAFVRMLRADADDALGAEVRLQDLAILAAAADRVPLDDDAAELLVRIRRSLDREGIFVSDRRYRHLVDYLRARAVVFGDGVLTDEVIQESWVCLWSEPGEIETVRRVVDEATQGHVSEAARLVEQGREVLDFAQRAWDTPEEEARALVEAHAKLSRLQREMASIEGRARHRGRHAGVAPLSEELAGLLQRLVAEGF